MSAITIETFGCRLNLAESDAIVREAERVGAAGLSIVNSCAVTGEALRQARQAARRLKRERPFARVVVAGCGAEIDAAAFAAMPEVDAVIGNREKRDGAALARIAAGAAPRVTVGANSTPPASPAIADARTRAFVEIQNGCDHRCTFCVIPLARGPSRSLDPAQIVADIQRLVANGVAEIVLTGVDITAYGLDAPDAPRLGGLVRRILAETPDLKRLRLSSIDSVEVDAELERAIAVEKRLMPHLHLSLQSGDDLVLKRMKRRHSRADAVRFCERARRARPDIAFSADIIVGFPTESEAMFENSLRLVADCGLARAHVFPFSPRPGTPAARMPRVPAGIARERAARLREASGAAWAKRLAQHVGRAAPILMERGGIGRMEDFTPVRLDGVAPGAICAAFIEASDGRELRGRIALATRRPSRDHERLLNGKRRRSAAGRLL
ncbi:MAG TPA: tRNA (N(6)-L-threonylcarbamoyladenosine(37)-C(2))-methylthiotransferase MtaB [Roseiarcus sp.]|nr:tRNA (N(6)-L-threonylcarbamoyladenosine(37)-C(2))-methylthiotransferase MtaB [Roseiarcus sp.]